MVSGRTRFKYERRTRSSSYWLPRLGGDCWNDIMVNGKSSIAICQHELFTSWNSVRQFDCTTERVSAGCWSLPLWYETKRNCRHQARSSSVAHSYFSSEFLELILVIRIESGTVW